MDRYQVFYDSYFGKHFDENCKSPNHREAVSRAADSYARQRMDECIGSDEIACTTVYHKYNGHDVSTNRPNPTNEHITCELMVDGRQIYRWATPDDLIDADAHYWSKHANYAVSTPTWSELLALVK